MSTQEFTNQFRLNMETIANFGGYQALKASSEEQTQEPLLTCEECGQMVVESEIKRNSGICDYCAENMPIGN